MQVEQDHVGVEHLVVRNGLPRVGDSDHPAYTETLEQPAQQEHVVGVVVDDQRDSIHERRGIMRQCREPVPLRGSGLTGHGVG
ncbi:MAG TPA: hypothetical protein VFH54_15600 [Mycobacteriales bacterium]|nr:hypothetical protein [Mycobacteriales bacterium]